MPLKTPKNIEWQDLAFLKAYLHKTIRHNDVQNTLNACDQVLTLTGEQNTPQDLANLVIRALKWSLDHTSTRKNLGPAAHHAREIAVKKYKRFVTIGTDLWDITGDYRHAKRVMNLIASPSLWGVDHSLETENTPAEDHGMIIYRDALMVIKGPFWWLWLKAVSGWEYWIDGGRMLGYPEPSTPKYPIKSFQVWENGQIRCHEKCPPMTSMNDFTEHVELRYHLDSIYQ